MTLSWLLLSAVALLWPIRSRAELRMLGLARSARPAAPPPGDKPLRTGVIFSGWPRWWVGGGRVRSRVSIAALAGVALVVAVLGGIALSFAASSALAVVARGVAARTGRRLLDQRRNRLSATVLTLRAELESGARPAEAFWAAAEILGPRPAASQCCEALRGAAQCTDPADVAQALARAPELRVLGRVWAIVAEVGIAPVPLLERVRNDVSARSDQAREVAAVLAGPRSSAMMLAGLPVVGLGFGAALGARPLDVLLRGAAGHAVLAIGVVLDALGIAWTMRMIRSAER